ncbi:hypothetical protein [Dyadobacter sp. NIV53]|uniref:hypothetical protein n=1 Tax=Dyadobacter sp. NIV53 TaxID=2861765 RepID=UPI001C885547|nr:hypothetical protein [Dyadobacter sp. NIV53]
MEIGEKLDLKKSNTISGDLISYGNTVIAPLLDGRGSVSDLLVAAKNRFFE